MTMRKWILVAGLALAGCGGSEAPPDQTTERPTRWWFFNELKQSSYSWGRAQPFFVRSEPFELIQRKDFGAQFASIPSSLGDPALAEAEVYSRSSSRATRETGSARHLSSRPSLPSSGRSGARPISHSSPTCGATGRARTPGSS
jgi:hypothetical protein